jgi:hypothetical protein
MAASIGICLEFTIIWRISLLYDLMFSPMRNIWGNIRRNLQPYRFLQVLELPGFAFGEKAAPEGECRDDQHHQSGNSEPGDDSFSLDNNVGPARSFDSFRDSLFDSFSHENPILSRKMLK